MSLQNKEPESLLQDVLGILVAANGHFAAVLEDDDLDFYNRTVARFSDFLKEKETEYPLQDGLCKDSNAR